MNWETFIEKNKDIANKIVWICDYRFNNEFIKKPIRHIKPTKVIIISNDELPKYKNVYYSDYHLKPISNKGKIQNKIIAPYDNTGYRSYTGVSLQIFENEEDCVSYYNLVLDSLIEKVEKEKTYIVEKYNSIISDFKKEYLNYKTKE